MKKVTFILLSISFVFIISCSKYSSVKNKDKEPNNHIEKAVQLNLDTIPFNTIIQEKGDVDWFKVNIPSQGYYRIMASSIPQNVKPEVRFALYQEWEGSKEKPISNWLRLPLAFHVAKAGTYYFKIHDDYDDAFSKNPIVLKTMFTKEFDKNEMNDVSKNATLTSFNQTLNFNIYPKGDYDWFKIGTENKKGYLKAMIKENYSNVKPKIKFVQYNEWDSNKITNLTGWLKFPAAVLLPPKGDVYYVIHDDYNDAATTKPYSLKLEYINQMDNEEPNNNYKTAKEASVGDTLHIALFPKGDIDFYKIKTNQGKTLKFLAKDWDNAIHPQVVMYSLNEDTNKLNRISEWEYFPHSFNVNANTVYYFSVLDDYNDAASDKTFVVIIK